MASWSKLPQCHAAGGIHANPCQSMPYWEHASGGVHLVRVKHSHHHVRPEVCLMCFVPSVTEDSWDIVPSAMCFVLLNIGTAPPGPEEVTT